MYKQRKLYRINKEEPTESEESLWHNQLIQELMLLWKQHRIRDLQTKIPRYAIQTKKNGTFSFSSKEPKKVLRAINQYIPSERLVRSLSFFDVLKRNFMPSKKNAKIKK